MLSTLEVLPKNNYGLSDNHKTVVLLNCRVTLVDPLCALILKEMVNWLAWFHLDTLSVPKQLYLQKCLSTKSGFRQELFHKC
jgi:hypothetical protein